MNSVEEFYSSHSFKTLNVNGVDWEYIVSGKGSKTVIIKLYHPEGEGGIFKASIRETKIDFEYIIVYNHI